MAKFLMHRLFLLVSSLSVLWFLPQAHAVEGGLGAYPNGFTGFYAGILAEPGTYFADYTYYYDAKPPGNISIPIIGGLQFGLTTRLLSNFLLLQHVTQMQFFGGYYGFAAIVPYMKTHVTVNTPLPHVTIQSEKTSLGDSELIPAILGWHWGSANLLGAMTIYIPTGSYDKHRLANTSVNHVVLQPNLAFTWLDPKKGQEVSANLIYNYNFTNKATNYKSGQELHMDYTLAQHFANGIGVGLGGYLYQQVTNDIGAPKILGGFKGRVYAIGPQIIYSTKVHGHQVDVQAKYQKEYKAKNHLQGHAFWFEFDFGF